MRSWPSTPPDAGELTGIRRMRYDGTALPVTAVELATAEVTTRDVDRGDVAALPAEGDHRVAAARCARRCAARSSSATACCARRSVTRAAPDIAARLGGGHDHAASASIGQGTAAIAGQSTAALLDELSDGELDIDAELGDRAVGLPAPPRHERHARDRRQPERHDDRHQPHGRPAARPRRSGDRDRQPPRERSRRQGRWRAVHLRRARHRDERRLHEGVLRPGRGRCAAGMRDHRGRRRRHRPAPGGAARRAARAARTAMERVQAKRDEIADAARRFAPSKRYWAVVGNGPNRVAAEEVRIKLSELCYKSIAADVDRGQEAHRPLVRAADPRLRRRSARQHRRRRRPRRPPIFRAHKATPIVIADEGDERYSAAATIAVPPVDPALGFVLSAMVGHLFGYEAALAIDGSARPLREAREAIERACRRQQRRRRRAGRRARRSSRRMPDRSSTGCAITSTTAISRPAPPCGWSACCAISCRPTPVEAVRSLVGRVGTPGALVDELCARSTRAIEELTRPIDAIKHQAKTVTVGISRSDEGVVDRALVQADAARRRRPRRAHVPHAQGARRPRSGGRRGHRLHPLPHRRRDDLDRRPRRDLPRSARRASTATRGSSAPSAASPESARCSWRAAGATSAR